MNKRVEEHIGYSIVHEPVLASMTSIGLGGTAVAHVLFADSASLAELPTLHKQLGGTLRPYGRGTNILAYDGTLALLLASFTGTDIATQKDTINGKILVRAEAGATLPILLSTTAKQSLSGLEGLSGIPGKIGGSIRMNAGSYGTEIGSLLHSIEVYTKTAGLQTYPREQIQYTYRQLQIQNVQEPFIICAATFALERGNSKKIKEQMDSFFAQKKATQPVSARSAGCIFKNPTHNQSAGLLLDQAGFKGKKLGGMAFSAIHANFLVNTGTGKSSEALALIAEAKEVLAEKTGFVLQEEVEIWS